MATGLGQYSHPFEDDDFYNEVNLDLKGLHIVEIRQRPDPYFGALEASLLNYPRSASQEVMKPNAQGSTKDITTLAGPTNWYKYNEQLELYVGASELHKELFIETQELIKLRCEELLCIIKSREQAMFPRTQGLGTPMIPKTSPQTPSTPAQKKTIYNLPDDATQDYQDWRDEEHGLPFPHLTSPVLSTSSHGSTSGDAQAWKETRHHIWTVYKTKIQSETLARKDKLLAVLREKATETVKTTARFRELKDPYHVYKTCQTLFQKRRVNGKNMVAAQQKLYACKSADFQTLKEYAEGFQTLLNDCTNHGGDVSSDMARMLFVGSLPIGDMTHKMCFRHIIDKYGEEKPQHVITLPELIEEVLDREEAETKRGHQRKCPGHGQGQRNWRTTNTANAANATGGTMRERRAATKCPHCNATVKHTPTECFQHPTHGEASLQRAVAKWREIVLTSKDEKRVRQAQGAIDRWSSKNKAMATDGTGTANATGVQQADTNATTQALLERIHKLERQLEEPGAAGGDAHAVTVAFDPETLTFGSVNMAVSTSGDKPARVIKPDLVTKVVGSTPLVRAAHSHPTPLEETSRNLKPSVGPNEWTSQDAPAVSSQDCGLALLGASLALPIVLANLLGLAAYVIDGVTDTLLLQALTLICIAPLGNFIAIKREKLSLLSNRERDPGNTQY